MVDETAATKDSGLIIPPGKSTSTPGSTPPEGFSPAPDAPQIPEGALVTEAAFLVYIDENGHWKASTEEFGRPLATQRIANLNDMYHAAADIVGDLNANKTADVLMFKMNQMGSQMREQAEAASIARRIGDPRMGGFPGAGH